MQGNGLEKESCAQLPLVVLFRVSSSGRQTKENRCICEAPMQDPLVLSCLLALYTSVLESVSEVGRAGARNRGYPEPARIGSSAGAPSSRNARVLVAFQLAPP